VCDGADLKIAKKPPSATSQLLMAASSPVRHRAEPIPTRAIYHATTAVAPARFQARVGKDFWRKFGAKRRKKSLPTLIFSLPTLDLIAWVGKDPPAIT